MRSYEKEVEDLEVAAGDLVEAVVVVALEVIIQYNDIMFSLSMEC